MMRRDLLRRAVLQRAPFEYGQQAKLKTHGLSHRRKLLLIGPPGTGKTMSARVQSAELRVPLNAIQTDKLVTKFMGEASATRRLIANSLGSFSSPPSIPNTLPREPKD